MVVAHCAGSTQKGFKMQRPEIYFFNSKSYEIKAFENSPLAKNLSFKFIPHRLDETSAKSIPDNSLICAFASDDLGEKVLTILKQKNIDKILLRSAGFNHVDIDYAKKEGFKIARVPAYSPESVAEHTVGLMLCLSRKIHKAYNRVREGNFSLEGLTGFTFHQKTVGIIGLGKIGMATAKIMRGFGCQVLAFDPMVSQELKEEAKENQIQISELQKIFTESDIVSLHCPLTQETKHLIDETAIDSMKDGVMLINTGRGALIKTSCLITALKTKKIGSLGLDVYEEEEKLFFADHSEEIIQDDTLMRLLSFPNVLITGHQAFLTNEALSNIAQTTLENALDLANERDCPNKIF